MRGGGESLEVKGACYNTSLTLVIPAYIHGYRPALLCLPAIPSLPPGTRPARPLQAPYPQPGDHHIAGCARAIRP